MKQKNEALLSHAGHDTMMRIGYLSVLVLIELFNLEMFDIEEGEEPPPLYDPAMNLLCSLLCF